VVPDSVKKEFRTSNNRKVYDGGGIDPDVKLNSEEASAVTQALFVSGHLFDYANLYATRHTAIAEPKKFNLTDSEYSEFASWMRGKAYSYQTEMEENLEKLNEVAHQEKYYSELKTPIDQLQNQIRESKKNDLILYKEQIKSLLEEEIVARYYLEKGAVESRFKNDIEIKKSIDLLHNSVEYKKILNIK
jgi:carboxyl-terminal processing protease